MFDRQAGSQELSFGVSGKLIMNNLVMYDRQTDSLWLQVSGEGIEGRYKGTQLETVPHVQTTWGAWRQAHPGTLVLNKGGGYDRDPYRSYYREPGAGPLGESRSDDRLPAKELVLGFVFGGKAKGYPFRILAGSPVVNDSLAETKLVVAFHEGSQTGQIFSRDVDGRVLTFDTAKPTPEDILIRDQETGTTWSGLSGEALKGPLEGEMLEPLSTFYAFWFAWKDFFLEAELYQPANR